MAVAENEPLWWQRGVVYQVYPRSFRDTNGDGIGDLAGVLEKLDYLSETLGVDAIWLSPFYPSPMKDFGYDISDFTDVGPLFGDLTTFDSLVAETHARGLKVIVDYVPNHSSDQHRWFLASRSARDNPYRDWYVWADPKPDGSPPNNWLGVFGGSAWEWDATTRQYYLHSFLAEQPDLNWRNPQVQHAMFDVLRFWMQRGVDGFRIDALSYAMKDPEMRDNPPNVGSGHLHKPLGEYDSQLHLYDNQHSDLHRLLRDLRAVLDERTATDGQPRVAIGEMHLYDLPRLTSYYGANLDELHLPFNFRLLRAEWDAQQIRDSVDTYDAGLPQGAWPNFVLGNHDESRIATRIGRHFAPAAMLLLLTLRGTPTLYYGDELGMEDVPIAPEHMQDPWGIAIPDLSRDPARTPMPWDRSPGGGFSAPGVQPWLPLGGDSARVSVAAQLEDPRSMLSLTRRLLALRRETPALAVGSYRSLKGDGIPADCFVYLREAAEQRILVAINFSTQELVVRLADLGTASALVSTSLDRDGSQDLAELRLRPTEGCVLELGDRPT